MGHHGLALLIPVLARPHRVEPLLSAIERTTPEPFRVAFISDADDEPECEAIERARAGRPWVANIAAGGRYASKIREGVRLTTEPLVFLGADDLEPHPGWFEKAAAHLTRQIQVVGVNDLIPRDRLHATHFLMTRRYAERPTIDNRPGPLYQGYAHWNCDDELIATAKKRGAYAYAEDAIVEHLHPFAEKAEDDETYKRGRLRRRQDARLFRQRSRLWS